MSEEQRDRQNLNLITGTHAIHRDRVDGHRKYNAAEAGYWNRWVRISLKAQDKKTIFRVFPHIQPKLAIESVVSKSSSKQQLF